jgi:hypothetical protein
MEKAVLDALRKYMDAGDVPTPIRILLKTPDGGKYYTALSTQYSLHARATNAVQAILDLLCNLANYVASCKRDKVFPISYASDIYQEAFDFGRAIKTPEIEGLVDGLIDLRGTTELLTLITKDEIELREAQGGLEVAARVLVPTS